MASGPDVAADGSREGTSSSTSSSIAPPEPGIRVLFKVDIHVAMEPNEGVYVSGSSPVLGEWQPAKAHPLEPHPEIPGRWIGLIIADADAISFRYFIGYKLFGEVEHLIVSQCEAHLNPRHVLIRAENRGGECRKNHVDIFEFYAGRRCVSEGWLQYDEENQILLSVHGRALKFFKADRTNCRIRVHPLDVRRRQPGFPLLPNVLACPGSVAEDEEDDEEPTASTLPSHSSTHVSALSSASSANSKYQPQPEKGDYLVFKTRSVAVEFLAFFIEIYSEDERRIGSCFALPSSLQETSGATSLPFINSSGRPIGQITVEYLFIRNLRKAHPPQLMDISYAKHWKKRSTIEVGHRGAGNSYTKFAAARENTIHSLNTAAANGADYVEFDVQLTKDKIAVIYHDFHVLLSVAKKMWDREGIELSDHYHEMALKDLKLKQLKLLKMEHMSHPEARPNVIKLVSDVEEEDDFSPFPTLLEALHKVDPDVGFNIEVKYPMMQEDGLHECANYFERNEFVDIILADVLAHAGCRRVMFSSFDPDICAMLSMKQHRYPVFFLCVGETKRYAKFKDQRCSNSLASVNFASGADILGINFNSEDLLNDPRPVRRAAELGLVSFVWGDDLDTKENIYYFKRELGVDGLIYDRIGEEERRRNVFVVEREAKRALNIITSGDSTPVRVSSPERDRSTNDQQAPTSPSKSRWATIREDDKEDLSASLEPESPPSNQSTVSSTGAVESLRDLSLVDNATNDGSYLPPSMVPMTSIS